MIRNKPTAFDYISKPTNFSDNFFDELQRRMPALALSRELRDNVRLVVSVYEGQIATSLSFRGSVNDRRRALRISRKCAQLLSEIAQLRKHNPLIAHTLLMPQSHRLDGDEVLSTLQYYEGIFRAFAGSAKKGPVTRQAQLHRLLHCLAPLYKRSGGVSTAVSNSREKSDFIDFAWEIIKHLPVVRRPNSKSGLAEEWEVWRAKYNASQDRRRLTTVKPKRL